MSDLATEPNIVLWNGSEQGFAFSGPMSLAPYAGQRLDLMIDEDQAAVIIEEHQVTGTLFAARHVVLVRGFGEESGDLSLSEIALRLQMEESEAAQIAPRVRHLAPNHMLMYVSLAPLPVFDWGESAVTPFHDAQRGNLDLQIGGECRLHVSDPAAFYRSFLRNTEDIEPSEFAGIAAALVHGSFVRALGQVAHELEALPPDPRELATKAAARMRPGLNLAGLELEQFEIARLELPFQVEPHRPATSDAAVDQH